MSEEEAAQSSPPPAENDPEGLETLLDYLHRTRGFDFSGYKRSSLARRIERRMQMVGIEAYAEYLDFLEVHPDEFQLLFNTILINVTGFFRDSAAWTALATHLPQKVASRAKEKPLRIWCAGCASGEEAYTLAMLLAEALGPEQFARRVKIYATDVDDEALATARQGVYGAKAVENVPPELLEKYFVRSGAGWSFQKELRRAVIFGRHDLVQDAPISRIDVLACRNTLMYFNVETQTRILNRLHFALNEDGVLFLGKAEMLLTHGNLFTPIDLKLRIFERTPRGVRARERMIAEASTTNGGGASAVGSSDIDDRRSSMYHASFTTNATAQIVVDPDGRTTLINGAAADLFGLSSQDVNRPFQDLEISYRPVELRSLLDQARAEKRTITMKEVERLLPTGEKMYLDIAVAPLLLGEGGAVLGWQVSFNDVTCYQRLQHDLRRANVDLAAAHEQLQSASEELETTNEELQSTVEELETTNEELQSTNEELETMNEELQSTNEELQTMNEEMRQQGVELNRVSSFFGSILANMHAGVLVLDGDLLVRAWNHKMEDLWGLRADEVIGKHVMNLDIGLPVESMSAAIRAGAGGNASEKTLECMNRRGKSIQCRVSMSPLRDSDHGVILFVEEVAPV